MRSRQRAAGRRGQPHPLRISSACTHTQQPSAVKPETGFSLGMGDAGQNVLISKHTQTRPQTKHTVRHISTIHIRVLQYGAFGPNLVQLLNNAVKRVHHQTAWRWRRWRNCAKRIITASQRVSRTQNTTTERSRIISARTRRKACWRRTLLPPYIIRVCIDLISWRQLRICRSPNRTRPRGPVTPCLARCRAHRTSSITTQSHPPPDTENSASKCMRGCIFGGSVAWRNG